MPLGWTRPQRDELVEHVDDRGDVIEVVTPLADACREPAATDRWRSSCTGTDGRLLVHRRADDKDVYPGWWDLAAGGVVGAGEAYGAAARRELAEELGVIGVDARVRDDRRVTTTSTPASCATSSASCTTGRSRSTTARSPRPGSSHPHELAELVATEPFLPGSLRDDRSH